MSRLTITNLSLSGGAFGLLTRCIFCDKAGTESLPVLGFHVTGEVREGKGHGGSFYLHPECFLDKLPAIYAMRHFLPPIQRILEGRTHETK